MSFKEKVESNRGVAIAICLFLLWGLEKIEHNRDVERHIDRIETLQTQKDRYEVSVDSLGAQTARQAVLLIDAKHEYESLAAQFTELKNTKSQTKVITKTQIDSVYVPVVSIDTMYVDGNFAPIYSFRDSSEFYSIAGRVSPELALLESVSFTNDIITKLKHILGSKADRSLKAYKSRRRKKIFFAYPRQARAIG